MSGSLLLLASVTAFAAKHHKDKPPTDDNPKPDGVQVHLQIQPRYTFTLSGDSSASDKDKYAGTGFRIRRAVIFLEGTAAGWVDYRIRFDPSKSFAVVDSGGKTTWAAKAGLDDAYVDLKAAPEFALQAGQYKVPFTGEEMMADKVTGFPERSIANEGVAYGDVSQKGLTRSRDIGLMAHGHLGDHIVEYQAGVFSGDGTNVFPALDTGYLYAARLQLTPLGEFKLDDGDDAHHAPKVALAVAVNTSFTPIYKDNGALDTTAQDTRVAGEVRYAGRGLTATGAVSYGAAKADVDADPTNKLGMSFLATYVIKDAHLMPGVRYARLSPDTSDSTKDLQAVDVVVNWFMPDLLHPAKDKDMGQDLKLQIDYGVVLDADGVLYHQGTAGLQLYL